MLSKLTIKQLSILLVILVVLSEVFSYVLLKGSRFIMTMDNRTNETTVKVAQTKDYQKVIRPTTFLWYQYQSTSGTTNIDDVTNVSKKLEGLVISDVQDVTDKVNINDIYNESEVFEYQFPGAISHYILADIYHMTFRNVSDEINFDTILVVNNNTTQSMYFYHKITNQLYQVVSDTIPDLDQQLRKTASGLNLSSYTALYLENRMFALPSNVDVIKPLKIATQDFNLNHLKSQVFFKAHTINQQQNSDIVEYNNGAALIRLDNKNNTMSYINPSINKLSDATPDDLISNSLNFLVQHQGHTANYLYSGVIVDKSLIEYRYFYNNIPVFGSEGNISKITMVVGENQDMYSYNRSNFILDVLYDESNSKYHLLTPDEVINYIQAQGIDGTQVYKIALGYELQHVDTNKAVYDLIPTWYYYYQNQWVKVEDTTLSLIDDNNEIINQE